VIRGVTSLSLGTATARALAAVGQLLLAFWLTPSDFGYWAAATSAMSILTGLANFGEVNGYLSGQSASFFRARRATVRINTVLAASGAVIAGLYWVGGQPQVAVLALISAVMIPIVGDAELVYSTGVKYKLYTRVVVGQVVAAVGKTLVAVLIASVTQSSLAFAISTIVFYVLMDRLILARVLGAVRGEPTNEPRIPLAKRIKWGANSLSVTLPIQIGFIVAQFGASPAVLGLYFFAYQISLGLSGLVSVPLARVTLSTLAETAPALRTGVAIKLSVLFGLGVAMLASVVSLLMPLAAATLGDEWATAAPATVVLLASLAVRMLTPILDGLQQAQNRWWQGTIFNAVDTVGTALAATVAFTNDLMLLVLAVAAWKIVFGLARAGWLLRAERPGKVLLLLFTMALASVLIASSPFLGAYGVSALLCSLAGAALVLAITLIRGRRSG